MLSDSFRKKRGHFFSNPAFWALLLVFVPMFWSGLYSENIFYWAGRMRIKMPFLGLPIAFFFLPKLTAQDFRRLAIFYVLMMCLTAIGVTIHYALNFEAINKLIGQGQNIPVPRNHIRFSLGIAIAVMISLGLFLDKKPLNRWQKRLGLVVAVLLFLFQHLLAVRSGIVGMYLGLLVFLAKALTQKEYRIYGFLGVFLLLLTPFLGRKYLPSLENKIGYMLYDWEMRQKGAGNNYSDSGRILSMQLGLKMGNEHPLLGIGAGDILDEMEQELRPMGITKELVPHNEYIYYYATTGGVGLTLFLMGILTPIFYRKHYKNTLFLSVQVILLLSFFVEPTLETAAGTGYYLLWLLLGLLYILDE